MAVNDGSILVVEDAPACRELLSTVLVQAGHAVREASSAEEALALADEERPTLVILDVVLPDVSGYELCRQLREQFGETLPIIFLSGSRMDSLDCVAGLLIGADDYVLKPFAPEELIARVRRALTRSAGLGRMGESADNGLTPREREVLSLLAEGLAQDGIADRLVISPKTVATHIQRILAKLGVHSRAEAISHAYRMGLVEDVVAHALAAVE